MVLRKIRKIFIVVLCTTMTFMALSLSPSATAGGIVKNAESDTISYPSAPDTVSADSITQIDLSDCCTELYDIDGNLVPMPGADLAADTIPSGYTMRFFQADGSEFYIEKNQRISINAQQDLSYNYGWRCGYGNVTLGKANSQTLSGSGICNATGSYSFFILNKTDHDIRIISGSIEYY